MAQDPNDSDRFWLILWLLALYALIIALTFGYVVYTKPDNGSDLFREICVLVVATSASLISGIYIGRNQRGDE